MSNSHEHDISPYFVELKTDHERIVDELVKDAKRGKHTTYKEAKDYINAQLNIVPNVRGIRADDCDMFNGLVRRAVNKINREQDNLEVHYYDGNENKEASNGKEAGKESKEKGRS